ARDIRCLARERAAVALRDRLERVAQAPTRRAPAAAGERPDAGGRPGGGPTRERRGARRARAVPTRGRRHRDTAGPRARGPAALRGGGAPVRGGGRGSRRADRPGTLQTQPRPGTPARTDRAEGEREE